MRKFYLLTCLLLLEFNYISARPVCSVHINPDKVINTFDGLGVLVSYGKLLYDYPEKQRNEILDYLFLPNFGASLQILKVEIGYDGSNTAMSWPSYRRQINETPVYGRGYGVWYMQEAKKRNPDIILAALHWGYPAWATTNKLKADFVADYVIGLYNEYGLHIDYIGGNQNESAITPEITKLIRQKLDDNGLSSVKIICADEGARVKKFKVLDILESDIEYNNAVDVIGVHYKNRPASFMPAKAYSFGKPIWSSEDGGGNYINLSSGRQWIDQLIKLLYDVKITGVIRWLATASIYDNMPWPNNGIMKTKEPWSGHYKIGNNLWAFAHFTQFIKPGWQLLDTGSQLMPQNNPINYGRHIAYYDKENGDYSIIISTYSDIDNDGITLNITNEKKLASRELNVWRSHFEKTDEQFVYIGKIRPDKEGKYSLNLDKDCVYSITTTSGQNKGQTSIPKPSEFSLPYIDDFEQYAIGSMAKYFVDANATFEIVDTSGNKVLKQCIREQPFLWHPGSKHVAQPLSELGSLHWENYSVQIDVLLENSGNVVLGGRVDSQIENNENQELDGYWLYLSDNGEWKLTIRNDYNESVKATGKISFATKKWANLKMEMIDDTISAYINNEKIAEIESEDFKKGNIAIATLSPNANDFHIPSDLYTTALFDNLIIQEIDVHID